MNTHIKKILLFLSVFFIIFNKVPGIIRLDFISGGYADKLSFYPIFILAIGLLYDYHERKIHIINSDKFLKYIFIYFILTLLSTLLGLINYPYYNLILNGPVSQIEKLPPIISFLNAQGIFIDSQWLLSFWMIARILKGNITTLLYTFTFSYIIYSYVYRNKKYGLSIFMNAIYFSIAIIFLYSVFEIFYLANNNCATYILSIITPYIHMVNYNNTWWPPLLWKGQLRSVFAEPSYFGMYAAFAIPFLWHDILLSKRWKIVSVITLLFSFLLFLTKARTAFVLHMGELLLLIIAFLICRKQFKFRKVLCILMCSFISFMGANLFLRYTILNNTNITQQIDITKELSNSTSQYLDDNVKTLANPGARSNGARYSVIIANLRIGMQHPFLGVGSGLKDAYITDNLPEMGLKNREVNMWMKNQAKKGILKSGYPNLCEYATKFAEIGAVGLIVFLFPMLYLIFKITKKIKLCIKEGIDNDKVIIYVAFLISFLGICATGLGDSLDITYCYWILLGLGYAMCYEDNKQKV